MLWLLSYRQFSHSNCILLQLNGSKRDVFKWIELIKCTNYLLLYCAMPNAANYKLLATKSRVDVFFKARSKSKKDTNNFQLKKNNLPFDSEMKGRR